MAERPVTLEALKEKYGIVEVGEKRINVMELMDKFRGEVIDAGVVMGEIEKQMGQPGEYAVASLDVFVNHHYLGEQEWVPGKGYKIGDEFNDVPVFFARPSGHGGEVVASNKADEFARLNPGWTRKEIELK